MAENHGAPEAGNLPRASTRGRGETESVRNEMRGVVGRVTASAAQRTLDYANPT